MDNIVTSNKKAKTAEINKLKEAKLAPINAQIAAKQKEIADVNNADMFETQRTWKLMILKSPAKSFGKQKRSD